jgi:hypothetical protein
MKLATGYEVTIEMSRVLLLQRLYLVADAVESLESGMESIETEY